ncbi:MAG: indole-3-glycerol phosphate synthase TrpC [Deltaproteobacteria bacterium]|nr:MAG: indole-3-glycerol phosphate synthase TrpC [Deltaproteobacteria bacterium]
MSTILDKIAASRMVRVREAKTSRPEALLKEKISSQSGALDVFGRLREFPGDKRPIIAEVKRKSPSKGDIAPTLNAAETASAYQRGGAFAISCLVEPDFFGGSLEDLASVRGAVDIPVLYKDFVVDPYQFLEARAFGADIVLLIVALLGDRTEEYHELAVQAGLTPLVEVHDEAELDIALRAGSRLVGVNNRNLKTFEVDLNVGASLLSGIGEGRYGVAESGIHSVRDMDFLAENGADAFLIGESLVSSGDPEGLLRTFVKRGRG